MKKKAAKKKAAKKKAPAKKTTLPWQKKAPAKQRQTNAEDTQRRHREV
jgi:hypothetical protein